MFVYAALNILVDDKNIHFVIMRFKGQYMRVQCVYGYDFHGMHAHLRGLNSLLILHQIIKT